MYIIDASYFQEDKVIPNANELNSNSVEVLNRLIDGKVRLFLKEILGFELFNDLDSNISNGVLNQNAPDKWNNLVNGYTYTKDGKTCRWQGLIYSDGTTNNSMLADLVYYYWLELNATSQTGVGLVQLKSKNAVNVSYNSLLSKHWNNFVRQYLISSLGYVSLCEFIIDNKTDYPNIELKGYKFKNEFGL